MKTNITRFIYTILVVSLLLLEVESGHAPLDYEFTKSLHTKYNLHWNNPIDGKMCMAVEVETLGWVGLGFSPNGDMVNSDIMMAWVIDGEVSITDRFAVSRSLPEEDNQQDIQLVNGYEEDGKTVIQFCRQLLTCDKNDIELTLGAVKVIYSWNDADPDPVPSKHITRGVKNLKLVGALKEFPAVLEDTTRIDITAGNISVPNTKSTVYWCRTIRFHQPATKHHIVKFGTHIDPRNTDYLHHLIVYSCPETFEELNGDCDSTDNLISQSGALDNCRSSVLSAWAVGTSDFEFPLDVGVPLGPDEAFDTVLIEVHYNNPNLDSGIIDDSGLHWYITDNVRMHDAGIFTLGHKVFDSIMVPPQTESYLISGFCPGECTELLFKEPINVIATFPHSHTAGVSIWTQIIRNKKEIEYLSKNLNYDFNFQGYIPHEPPTVLLPGDDLILNCLYSTKQRDDFTIGGQSTQDEMCFDFIYYYPKLNSTLCIIHNQRDKTFAAALDSFQCNNVDVNGSTTNEELLARARNIEWTDTISRTLEISTLVDPHQATVYCDVEEIFEPKYPLPGVDYEVFPYRYDACGNYNGTYYPGGNTADYYYDCITNEPYYDPVGPTGSSHSLTILPIVVWMLVVAVLYLF